MSWLSDLAVFAEHVAHPDVQVVLAPGWVKRTRDVEVPVRDGTILRMDVYTDDRDSAPRPVIMSAHPYGKDKLPHKKGPVWVVSPQYRVFRMTGPISFSEYTGWEAPDPAFWVEHGYAVVNCDVRGAGTSDGKWNPLSKQEGEDVADVIEWIAQQPWCDGNVGMMGVSYLALSQYQSSALNPPHLKAICPWEGFTDIYRDFARPGGIQEDGFLSMWSHLTSRITRTDVDLLADVHEHELDDEFYDSLRAPIEDIRVPMLVCGSFSDHLLHSRGSLEAFRRAGSEKKWLWTHRGGKWTTFYSEEAKADQLAFFDHFLKGEDNGWVERPAVRLVTLDGPQEQVELVDEFPPGDVSPVRLFVQPDGSLDRRTPGAGQLLWSDRGSPLTLTWRVAEDVRLTGTMELDVVISCDAEDADIIVAIGHWRDGRRIDYEGSYGFAHDYITQGFLRASQRRVDEVKSSEGAPVLSHSSSEPLAVGEQVRLRVPMHASSTSLRAGDELRVELHSSWMWPHNAATGQFPARYVTLRNPAPITIYAGSDAGSALVVPMRE